MLNVAGTFQKCKNNRVIKFLAFQLLCSNCLFVEVSNNDIFDFHTSNSCFFNFVNWGSAMTKRLKSTGLE